jgi:hypothetical protein
MCLGMNAVRRIVSWVRFQKRGKKRGINAEKQPRKGGFWHEMDPRMNPIDGSGVSPYNESVFVPGTYLAIVIVAIALGGVYTFYGGHAAERRRREMAALAVRRGLTFTSSFNYSLANDVPGFRPMHTGQDSYAYNIIKGTLAGRSVYAFDYHYQLLTKVDQYGEEHAYHYSFSAVVACSNVTLKPLVIRPVGFLDKLGEAAGFEEIGFESAEFSRRYHVTSPDRRWAYDVLHQRAIELLLQGPLLSIEFSYDNVIAYRGLGNKLSVEEIDTAIDVVGGILDRLPDYLVQQQGTKP